MYKKMDRDQLFLDDFKMQFGGKLRKDNRWVQMSNLTPWDIIEDEYAKYFSKDSGVYAINARIAYGAIFVKEYVNLDDRGTVQYIMENPYVQYYLGLNEFTQEPLFDPSMMVLFRKRFTKDFIDKINRIMFEPEAEAMLAKEKETAAVDREYDDNGTPPTTGSESNESPEPRKGNKGKLIIDATVAPADIRYPNDLSLLNEARENQERIIEELWPKSNRKGHKTGYSRRKARKEYLGVAKQKKPRRSKVRRVIGLQLCFIEKNIETINKLLQEIGTYDLLAIKHYERIKTIKEVYLQQLGMYQTRTNTCENRIVSLRQPHIRPIIRGKAGKTCEFGQKLTVSVINGYTFIDRQDYNNFNEGITLKESVEQYHKRYGFYPEAVLADTIYRNRVNLTYCKEKGIRLSGPRLGRPKLKPTKEEKRHTIMDSAERNMVESRFGIAKRRFGLDLIMAYLPKTGQTEAALQVLCMNMSRLLRLKLLFIFSFFKSFNFRYEIIKFA
jgi:hypothetical protein